MGDLGLGSNGLDEVRQNELARNILQIIKSPATG